jgi:hypothetical protein
MPLLIRIRSLLHHGGAEHTIDIRFLETQPHQFGVEYNVTNGLARFHEVIIILGGELYSTINDVWGKRLLCLGYTKL